MCVGTFAVAGVLFVEGSGRLQGGAWGTRDGNAQRQVAERLQAGQIVVLLVHVVGRPQANNGLDQQGVPDARQPLAVPDRHMFSVVLIYG